MTIAPLQRVQNAAARLVCKLGTKEHVTQVYSRLPAALVTSPLAVAVQNLLHHALNLSWLLSRVSDEYRTVCCCQLTAFRSSVIIFYVTMCAKTSECAFRHAGPSA